MDSLMLALRVVFALGAVVGVLWFIQKRVNALQTRAGAGDPLTVIARRGVGTKASVVVLDTGGKRFLLGVTEHTVNVLHADDAPEPGPDFEDALARAAASRPGAAPAVFPLHRMKAGDALAPSLLSGSLLAPDTWKQTFRALMGGPLR